MNPGAFEPSMALRRDAGRVELHADVESLALAASDAFAAAASAALSARGRFAVALSGGATPLWLYRLLAGREGIDWARIDLFFGDERCVPPDHAESNYHRVSEALLVPAKVPAASVHRIEGELADRFLAAETYERELGARVPRDADGRPRFDLVLLGLGADGHTASLFPGSAALAEERRWAVAVDAEPPRAARITLTVPVLNAAAEILFLVAGAEKAGALRAALGAAEPVDASRASPARRIAPRQGQLRWLIDRAAAAGLLG